MRNRHIYDSFTGGIQINEGLESIMIAIGKEKCSRFQITIPSTVSSKLSNLLP